MVKFSDVVNSREYKNNEMELPIALGKDDNGNNIIVDLVDMPHLLIAGTTGSGKSVCLDTIVMSLSKSNARMLLIDPKRVNLSIYNNTSFIMGNVYCENREIAGVLDWVIKEMEARYELLAKERVRDLKSYNKILGKERLDRIVVIIDEYADIIYQCREIEQKVAAIAQKSRACGIHLVLTTQRPSANVVTGVIKANIPARIAMTVATSVDSRVILDEVGAEKLNGNGDMLLKIPGRSLIRLQGAYISEEEIRRNLKYVNRQVVKEEKLEEKESFEYEEILNQIYEDLKKDPKEYVTIGWMQRGYRLHKYEAEVIYSEMIRRGILED